MTDFHFLRPLWLFAFIPLTVLIGLLIRRRASPSVWARVCDERLLPYILLQPAGRAAHWPVVLFMLGGAFAILALAGPTWERLPVPVFRNQSALVIVLDLSLSMDAADIKPNRLERARYKIADIIHLRRDGQNALVVYAGDAFTVTPLTDDGETIISQLSALATYLMPEQGNRPGNALHLAARLLRQAGLQSGDILLITDSVDFDRTSAVARELKVQSYRVSVLGVGTSEGAPIPMQEGGFVEDEHGRIVIPRLQTTSLKQLAAAGGGAYYTVTTGNGDVTSLLAFIDRRAREEQRSEDALQIERWEEAGPWLLLGLLPLAALAFRRGYLACLLFFALQAPDSAQALDWSTLWRTPDQAAQKAFQQGDYGRAADAFEQPAWKAAAEYKSGHYEEAAKTLNALNTSDSHYNRGNALAQLRRYPEAIEAYDQALQLDPDNQDARANKELVEKALRQPRQQPERRAQPPQQREEQPDHDAPQSLQGQQGQSPQDRENNGQASDAQAAAQNDNSAGAGSKPDQPEGASEQARQAPNAEPEPGRIGNAEPKNGQKPVTSDAENTSQDEAQQANEQWLRRIPDDPGGLLKRKFYYQYQQRQRQRRQPGEEKW